MEGLAAYREKEAIFYQHVEKLHGSYVAPPMVSTYHFAMMSGIDVTMQGKPRLSLQSRCALL